MPQGNRDSFMIHVMILMTIMKTVLTIKKVIMKMMVRRICMKTILMKLRNSYQNISINDQNVPNIKMGQTVSFSLNDYITLLKLNRAWKANIKTTLM